MKLASLIAALLLAAAVPGAAEARTQKTFAYPADKVFAASVRFIEHSQLLADVGGVGASLRYLS